MEREIRRRMRKYARLGLRDIVISLGLELLWLRITAK